ncbi:MAG: OadG family protein [Oscillospiraceae bacterium]|jgi:Na+-transporting methylmalonyl-CoA/oxaloacetate decarboxylase gamma subunit
MDWGSIVAVVITGLVVVFLALVGLVLILYITGFIVPKITKVGQKKQPEEPAQKAAPAAAAPVKAEFVPPVGPGPVAEAAVEDGIPGKTVAAISAAVAVTLEGQGSYVVKSIKRSEK